MLLSFVGLAGPPFGGTDRVHLKDRTFMCTLSVARIRQHAGRTSRVPARTESFRILRHNAKVPGLLLLLPKLGVVSPPAPDDHATDTADTDPDHLRLRHPAQERRISSCLTVALSCAIR